jgi:hypothetical protein
MQCVLGDLFVPTPWDSFIDTIERRQQQLREVLEAYRVFREKLSHLPPDLAKEAEAQLRPSESASHVESAAVPPRTNECSGLSSLECARIVLQERDNEPMHYSQLAREILKRGYKGRKSGSDEEVEQRTTQSLWAALSRSEQFLGTGNGFYKLNSGPWLSL